MKTFASAWVSAIVLMTTACFAPASTTCSTGLVCPAGTKCTHDGTQCMAASATCGDGKVDPGEACDDGNVSDYDGCRADCQGRALCGDGHIDSDLLDASGQVLEVCDDGNTRSGDGCSADCRSLESCGNGLVDVGEECDDRHAQVSDCRATCLWKRCGDGIVNGYLDGGTEECDDGTPDGGPESNGGRRCTANCLLKRCGNGLVERFSASTDEQCDDGNRNAADGCGPTCLLEVCGNGFLDPGEVCDFGPHVSGDGCRADCKGEERCGDGLLDGFFSDGGLNEQCDDGNALTETSCPYGQTTCTACNASCSAALSLVGGVCGDGVVNSPQERCDDGNNFACGTCNANCSLDQPLFEAQGTIATEADEQLVDGETLTLRDGVHSQTVLCLKRLASSACTGAQVSVELSSGGPFNQEQVADALIAAINAVGTSLGITASKRSSNPWVRLTNDAIGGFGNQALSETVSASGFVVTGMSGGGGSDCPPLSGCVSAGDCLSGTCTAHLCQ